MLVGLIMLIVYLQVALRVLVQQSAAELTARAESTPLLVGAKGSPLELALNSLYLESETPELTTYAEVTRVAGTGLAQAVQILRPSTVIDELLDTVLTIQSFVVAGLALVGAAALATAVLVFALSLRIRKREIETMVKIGGSRASILSVLTAEILLVVVLAVTLAGALTVLTSTFGSTAIRAVLFS